MSSVPQAIDREVTTAMTSYNGNGDGVLSFDEFIRRSYLAGIH
jgi:hypothetical protein